LENGTLRLVLALGELLLVFDLILTAFFNKHLWLISKLLIQELLISLAILILYRILQLLKVSFLDLAPPVEVKPELLLMIAIVASQVDVNI
jgi:hypothetical protein